MSETVRVEYVGLKPSETDHLYGTRITWTGLGDIQDVPVAAWEKMARHTDVWKMADVQASDETLSLADAKTLAKALDDMTDDELREFAKAKGIRVHHKQTGAKLVDVIRAMLGKPATAEA